ncbi:19766_t:CDS:2, partial [Gigaspora margarita]
VVERADIEGSKSNVTMNVWLPEASHTFMVCIYTENQNQGSFTLVLLEIFVLNKPPVLSFNRCATPAKLLPNVFNSD